MPVEELLSGCVGDQGEAVVQEVFKVTFFEDESEGQEVKQRLDYTGF